MMHIGCSCTDQRHAPTVVVKDARDIKVGDMIVATTPDEVAAFTGSAEQVATMIGRDSRRVTEIYERGFRVVIRHGAFFTNVARPTRMIVEVPC